eukprot:scaffold17672_cov111-Isochrysis_galbana.AAC.1
MGMKYAICNMNAVCARGRNDAIPGSDRSYPPANESLLLTQPTPIGWRCSWAIEPQPPPAPPARHAHPAPPPHPRCTAT